MKLARTDYVLTQLIHTAFPPAGSAVHSFDALAVDWQGVAERAKFHGLVPLLYLSLKRLALPAQVPVDVFERLQMDFYLAVANSELRRRELNGLLRSLSAQGVTPIVLKGAALAYLVYPDPACRPMGDVDLWIKSEEILETTEALKSIGYDQREKVDRPLALQLQNGGEIQMFGTRGDIGLVELHLGAFPGEWIRWTAHLDEAGVRARSLPVKLADESALALSAEDTVIQLVVHFAISHQLSEPGLRALVDILLVARRQSVNWELLALRAREWRVATACWMVLKLAAELIGLAEATPAITALKPSPLRSRLIGFFANAETILEKRNLSQSPIRLAYLLLLVDRLRDLFWLVGRSIWPEDSWLAARYGQAGWHQRFAHLTGAFRGKF